MSMTVAHLQKAGIPAVGERNYKPGRSRIVVSSGNLDISPEPSVNRPTYILFTWTPHAVRPLFQANDAERFVILASLFSAIHDHHGEVVDPLHQAMRRISEAEPPTAPATEYWRSVIDRAVAEMGSKP